jgi:hypothetical protein
LGWTRPDEESKPATPVYPSFLGYVCGRLLVQEKSVIQKNNLRRVVSVLSAGTRDFEQSSLPA